MKFLNARFAFAIIFCCAPAFAQTTFYNITELSFWPFAINNQGQIVGVAYSTDPSYCFQAVIDNGGVVTPLGTLGGDSYPLALNDAGVAVGYSTTNGCEQGQGSSPDHAVIFNAGGVTDLAPLVGTGSRAYSISQNGQIVGPGFLYANGTVQSLGTLQAGAINNATDIIGTIPNGSSPHVYSRFPIHNIFYQFDLGLGTFCWTDYHQPLFVNEAGQVAHCLNDTFYPYAQHALLHAGGTITDLAPMTTPMGLNDFGQVVGIVDGVVSPPYLYTAGQVINVNTLVDSKSYGWQLWQLYGINDLGQIIGEGTGPSGGYTFFVGTPVLRSDCTATSYATQFADVDGDGKADAIAINDTGILVRRSDGTKFVTPQAWTHEPYYGVYHDGSTAVGNIYFADVTGDGRADAIVVNDGQIVVRPSDGTQFLANQVWGSGQFWGVYHTGSPAVAHYNVYFADVNGDGKADAIAVNDSGITVWLSTGSGFQAGQLWSNVAYFGNVGTYFADVTGDGAADAIVINGFGAVTVRSSTGSSFSTTQTSWPSTIFFPTSVVPAFANVDGITRNFTRTGWRYWSASDLILNAPAQGISVELSAQSAFWPASSWTTSPYTGTVTTTYADVTGDGRADAIVVNPGGITVRRSNGSSFTGNETWTTGPFFGFHDPVCHGS